MSYHDSDEIDKIFNILDSEKKQRLELISHDTKESDSSLCMHPDIDTTSQVHICKKCGLEIFIAPVAENKYQNTSRVLTKMDAKKSIIMHLDKIKSLPDYLKPQINNEYYELFKTIHRANKLYGILFAMTFKKCRDHDINITPEEIYKDLGIDKKTASGGRREYTKVKEKDTVEKFTTAKNYIKPLMEKFNGNEADINNIQKIYTMIEGKSHVINSSNPLSVCAAMIYYYSNLINKNIPIAEFSKIVGPSVATITKISKNISEIITEVYRKKPTS